MDKFRFSDITVYQLDELGDINFVHYLEQSGQYYMLFVVQRNFHVGLIYLNQKETEVIAIEPDLNCKKAGLTLQGEDVIISGEFYRKWGHEDSENELDLKKSFKAESGKTKELDFVDTQLFEPKHIDPDPDSNVLNFRSSNLNSHLRLLHKENDIAAFSVFDEPAILIPPYIIDNKDLNGDYYGLHIIVARFEEMDYFSVLFEEMIYPSLPIIKKQLNDKNVIYFGYITLNCSINDLESCALEITELNSNIRRKHNFEVLEISEVSETISFSFPRHFSGGYYSFRIGMNQKNKQGSKYLAIKPISYLEILPGNIYFDYSKRLEKEINNLDKQRQITQLLTFFGLFIVVLYSNLETIPKAILATFFGGIWVPVFINIFRKFLK